jgi:hypothetical protein
VDDELLSFEAHRRRREENASTVRCVRCGKWIVATATRCPECGVHFQGEAQEFIHPSEQSRASTGPSAWVIAVAVLLIAVLAFDFRLGGPIGLIAGWLLGKVLSRRGSQHSPWVPGPDAEPRRLPLRRAGT